MIKFFRHIRRKLLSESRFNRYLIYAIGEIALVMIGILLALQVNNWNQNRKESQAIQGFYMSMIDELDINIKQGLEIKRRDSLLILDHTRLLNIFNNRQIDSVDVFRQLLGSTATIFRSQYSFPVAEEFLERDYLSNIEDLKIRENFTQFSSHLERIKGANEYASSQYTNAIEPYFIKHINYTDVAHEGFIKFLVKGGPKTDYDLSLIHISETTRPY